jgi:3-dehydroquinate synthase
MGLDKKAEAGETRFVVIEALGRAGVRTAPEDVVRRVLEAHCAAA